MDTNKNILNISGACFDHVDVSSDGIWNEKPGDSILIHSLFRLHVRLIALFVLVNCFHFALKRFHFSRFTSEILTGIVIGPTVLGRFLGNGSPALFPTAGPNEIAVLLSKIGYMFFVFFAGVRMETSLIKKSGKTALLLGIFLFAVASVMVQCVGYDFANANQLTLSTRNTKQTEATIYFTGIVQTQFVGVSCLLTQLKLVNSQLGHLALASSLLNEIVKLTYGTVLGLSNALLNISHRVGIQAMTFSLVYVLFIVFVLRRLTFSFIRKTPEGQPVKEIYNGITIGLVFLLSTTGDMVGLHYALGPMIFGLVVPARSPLAQVLVAKFDTAVSGFLLPIMSMFCASKIDLWKFFAEFDRLLIFKISMIGFVIKFVLTFFGVCCCRLPLRHSFALAIILNAKGLLEVGVLLSFGDIEEMETWSGILLVFVLQAFQPHIVKKLYDPAEHYVGYRGKRIENASEDAELHVLACAHRQEDAMAAIKLLEYSNPTKQSPLYIYGLCLEELVSSFTPVLINHQLCQKNSSSSFEGSRSKPIIDIFKYFESQHKKLAQVNVFTAVSPVKEMHEDICRLSFDKACSLIITPFHKKWNRKGKVVSANSGLRNLNVNLLGRAPCSVGILIDRHKTNGLPSIFATSTLYRVASLFLGGPHDREAMAYALRMAGNPRVHLTIIRFITLTYDVHHRWESRRDDQFLESLRTKLSGDGRNNICFTEETVRDGSDTSNIVQSIMGEYDLIMVGRCHETEPEALRGLSAWIDVPELGPIGDMLASEDLPSVASVLVVQQQIMKASHSSILN